MHEFIDFAKNHINPEFVIKTYGIWLILFMIFAETGLFFGFFFPGDSLLFSAGLFAKAINSDTGRPFLDVPIMALVGSVFVVAILGNFVGYWFGRRTGPRLFRREDSLIFKKKYMDMTQSFYDKHGKVALIAGRFLPIIRTFVPILAGVIKLDFKKFALYNVVGAFLWVFSFTLAGYFLAYIDGVQENLHIIVIILIIVTILPVVRTILRERKKHAASKRAENSL